MLMVNRLLAHTLLLSAALGCQIFDGDFDLTSGGRSPLQAVSRSPNSVTLEIFWARFPADSVDLNEQVWREVQEDRLSPELRSRLARQGLRAGVISGSPPAAIMAMLNPAGRKVEELAAEQQLDPTSFAETPKVTRRIKQLKVGTRMELQASDIIESAQLLVPSDGELSGGTFAQAQAIYQLEAKSLPNRTVELQLTPEMQYGPQQMRWSKDEMGNLIPLPLRDAEVFRDLRMNVPLAPGEMVVVMGQPNAVGRLGHYFHSVDTATGREQKAVLIRLADGPKTEEFQTASANSTWW